MALSNDIKDLGVKFYASKSYDEAIELAESEPGSICFVSDESGNFIILDGLAFGSGSGGSGGGGAVSSVNGKIGAVILSAADIKIVKDGNNLLTISDFLKEDGTIVSKGITIKDGDNVILSIDDDTFTYRNNSIATQSWVEEYFQNAGVNPGITEEIKKEISDLKDELKEYTDSLTSTIYKFKGSVANTIALQQISNPQNGDVYNVVASSGTIGQPGYVPGGTNYACIINEEGQVTWDALAGSIDLSNYLTKTGVESLISSSETSQKAYVGEQLKPINTTLTGLTNTVFAQGQTISSINSTTTENTQKIETNITNINNISKVLTWQ